MRNLSLIKMDIYDFATSDDTEKVASIVEKLPDNVKTSHIPSLEDTMSRPEQDFAVVLWDSGSTAMPKYACFSPELTELNMACLVESMNDMPDEIVKLAAKNLTASAYKFDLDIPEPLYKFASRTYGSRIIDVSNIDEKSFLIKTAKGCKKATKPKKTALHGKYPIGTKEELKKAASWFSNNHNKLNLDEIEEFVSNFSKQAELLNFHIEGPIQEYSILEKTAFNENFYDFMQLRKNLLRGDDEDGLYVINDLVRRADELGVEKTACVLEVIDKELGLNQYYGKDLPNPINSVYGFTKTASILVDDTRITQEMLNELSNEELAEIVGNGVVSELKGPDGLTIFNSLPTPIKQGIIKLLESQNAG